MLKIFYNKENKLKYRFLVNGFINTVFGYFCGVVVYNYFYEKFSIILIGLLSNFISITFSFFTNKFFVFKDSKGSFLFQYIKSFLTHSIIVVIGIFTLWICIEIFFFNIYITQAMVVGISIILLYILHKNFTFK